MNIFNLLLSKFAILLANIFDINYPYNLNLPTSLRLGLNYLCSCKFRRNFKNYINPKCDCGLEIKTTAHFLFYFFLFQSARKFLLIKITKINKRVLEKHDKLVKKYLVYDRDKFDLFCNNSVIYGI